MFRTLRSRLWLAIAAAVVLALAVTLLAASFGWQNGLSEVRGRELQRHASVLAALYGTPGGPGFAVAADSLTNEGEHVLVLDLAVAARLLRPPESAKLRAGRALQSQLTYGGVDYLAGVHRAGDSAILVAVEAQDLAGYGMPQWVPIAALALGVAVALGVALVVALGVVRPLRRVVAAGQELALGRTPPPVPVRGPAELRDLSEAFNTMAEQLTAAKEAERVFLSTVSHELRTPMAAISGFAQAQKDGVVSAAEATDQILIEAARLERLVQDLLDLARLRLTQFALEPRDVDLADVAAATVCRHAQRARDVGVSLVLAPGDGAPAPARGDPDRVLQVLSNLVENALRATPPGGRVTVSVELGVAEVSDTGAGLRPEDLEHAFDRFYLHRRYVADGTLGSGLGLALVRELVTAMGGSVTVRSELGHGSSFRISLPLPNQSGSGSSPAGR